MWSKLGLMHEYLLSFKMLEEWNDWDKSHSLFKDSVVTKVLKFMDLCCFAPISQKLSFKTSYLSTSLLTMSFCRFIDPEDWSPIRTTTSTLVIFFTNKILATEKTLSISSKWTYRDLNHFQWWTYCVMNRKSNFIPDSNG